MRYPCLLVFLSAVFSFTGCNRAMSGLVIVVTASYPGANAHVVAETVATPIEQQINGAEGMVRIESESRSDGSYIARLRFGSKADPKVAMKLIENRVALAAPVLPDQVRRIGVSVKVGVVEDDQNRVAIALIDRQGHGWDELQKWADAVGKRLATDGVITKPETFPVEGKQISVHIDRAKCARLGVTLADVDKAMQTAGPAAKLDTLKKLAVGNKVSLGEVADIKEVTGPAAIYRLNLYPAIRVTGTPPKGKSVAGAAAGCVELAEGEKNRIHAEGFAVENLAAK